MTNLQKIELFLLKSAPIRAELESILEAHDPELVQEIVGREADSMLEGYAAQISIELRRKAARMAEYYRIFYMLENYIRDFVDSIMTDAFDDEWWENKVPDNIKDAAKRSKEKELNLGVTPRSDDPILYITFGELMGIMSANWDQFAGLFPSSKGLENVMGRLNTLRGPIMHCGDLAEDEVLRLKLSVRDWFKLSAQGPGLGAPA
ncbi:MAG: Swt1 family HEPN domain-containing protein [Caulobacter sp.]|nr:Swt1 family HEPN domain-containing protein [Caulobacter sp.]